MNEQTSAWKSRHSVGRQEEIVYEAGDQRRRGGGEQEETSDVMYGR